jgi:hypothetical protein
VSIHKIRSRKILGAWLLLNALLPVHKALALTLTHSSSADFNSGSGDDHVSFTATVDGEVALKKMAGPLGAFNSPTTLPFAMVSIGAFASSTHIYLAGMADAAGNATNNVFSAPYSGSSLGAWTALSNLPMALQLSGVATWRNHVYLVGGALTGGSLGTQVLEAAILPGGGLGTWNARTPLPVGDGGARAAAAKGYLFKASVNVNSAPILADGSLGAWATLGAMPADAQGGNFAYADGYLWLADGDPGSTPFSTKTYSAKVNDDGTLGAWVQQASSLPQAKTWFGTTQSGGAGKFFMLGGRTGLFGPWGSTEVYSSSFVGGGAVSAWGAEASLPAARGAGNVIVSSDAIWYLGGIDSASTKMNTVFRSAFSTTAANAHSGVYENGFDLGAVLPLNSLAWSSNNAAFLSCQVRTADATKVFGAWSAATTTSPIPLAGSARYVEYRFDFADPGSGNTLHLDDITLDYSPAATETSTNTPTATETPTSTETPSFTDTASQTATETSTMSPSATGTFSPTPTSTETPVSSLTNSPSSTSTLTATPSSSSTNTPAATATDTPTTSPTSTQTPTHTETPVVTPNPLNAAEIGSTFIFPSPVLGNSATLAYFMPKAGKMRLDLWNEAGALAASFEDSKGVGPQYKAFDVSSFAAGIYLGRITRNYDDGQSDPPVFKKFGVIK